MPTASLPTIRPIGSTANKTPRQVEHEVWISMRNTKRSIQSAVTIDGFPMMWELHREQNWSADQNPTGMAIHVWVVGPARRELYLEYPAIRKRTNGLAAPVETLRLPISAAKVADHIREAMAAGWDPDSRGKPFVCELADLPS